jgi:hypothetical protein
LSAISRWATDVRQVTVLPVFNPGTVTSADQTFCSSGNPSNISLSQIPVGSGAYQWRWYFRESSTGDCPSGSQIPQGWLTNSGATISGTSTTGAGISYDPQSAGSLNNGRSFAVLITPIANGNIPACGSAQWASSCRKLFVIPCPDFTPGAIASGAETLCNGGDPAVISFSTFPSSGSTYRWYYQNALVSTPNPGDPTTGWTAIGNSNTANYNPPAGLTTTRSYACRITNGANSQWAAGVRQVTVLAPFSPGVVISEDQTFCNSGNPSAINLSQNPSGSGAYQYRWYFRESANGDCPSGSTIPSGWNTNNTSVNISGTSLNGTGLTFDPNVAGNVNQGRTFAVFITPISNGNSPACGTPQWASGCRKTFVIPCTGFNAGIIASADETICNAGDPSNVYLAQVPTNGSARQWYYQDGIVAAPLSTDPTTGWTLISGATGLNYNPPTGLTQSRTYGCRVINGANNEWAAGVRQVTVLAPVNIGIITSADQTFCNSGNPANITLSTDPAGSGAYQWRWYFRESANGDCPTGATIPAGWNTNNTSPNITGTTTTGAGISFNPISAGSVGNGRTFAVFITPIASGNNPACATPQWAGSCRKTIVNPCRIEEEEAPEVSVETTPEAPFLGQSYPNPNQGSFRVNYYLPKQYTQGSIAMYDVTGKKVTEIKCTTGEKQLTEFDVQLLPSGTYYYSLETQGLKIATKKLIIVK